jgi:hypothetical protein
MQRFITCSNKATTGPYPEPDESRIFYANFLYFPLIYVYVFQIVFFLRGFRLQFCKHISPMRPTCFANLIILDLFIITLVESTQYKAFHCTTYSCYLSVLGQNVVFITLVTNTHNLCSSLYARNQVLNIYKRTGKIVMYLI